MNKSIISLTIATVLITSFIACGNSSSTSNSKTTDIAKYFEKNSQVKNIVTIFQDSRETEETETYSEEDIVLKDNSITYNINNTIAVIVTINKEDLNITIPSRNNFSYLVKRHVNVGEEISSYTISSSEIRDNNLSIKRKRTKTCIFDAKLNSLTLSSKKVTRTYEGDIFRQKCTTLTVETHSDVNETFNDLDINYTYHQLDKGQIAVENKDCWTQHINSSPDTNNTYNLINDNSKECSIRLNTQIFLLE